MGWRRVRFKDAQVWAEVDAAGALVVHGGRVAIRYSAADGAKVYRAGASGITVEGSSPIEALDSGVPADLPGGATARGSGFGKAGTRTASHAAAAASDARSRMARHTPDTVVVFTDGACKGNPGPTGAGAVVRMPDGAAWEGSVALGQATNNVGELAAIGLALELLDEAGVPPEHPVAAYSDSSYARGVLTQGWKAKANQARIAQIREALQARPGLALHWVAGHVGIDGNERADQLANMGAAGISTRRRVEPHLPPSPR
jgi:ribonuclease HI